MAMQDITLDLWNIAMKRADLTDQELESFSGATNSGEDTELLATLITGIGCLINSDQDKTGNRSGALQDGDETELLFAVSNLLNHIAARERIASDASFMLRERLESRITA